MTALVPESPDVAARLLPMTGVSNARDVGGYLTPHGPIAWRRLLRSAGLEGLDDASRTFLAELGLRTIVDLRRHEELDEQPSALADLAVETVHVSIISGALPVDVTTVHSLDAIYDGILEGSGPALVDAVTAIARPGALPALVHCTAGKDRTGVVIAFVLALLGVDDDVIAADFALSAELLGDRFADRFGDAETAAAMRPLLVSPPELIHRVLATARARHGGVEEYLLRHGMDAAVPVELRAALIES